MALGSEDVSANEAPPAAQIRSCLNGAAPAFVPQKNVVKPFRFMEFPREIRNQVYEDLLCPHPDRETDLDGLDDRLPDTAHLFETAILCTNRQVYAEAREAMLRGNQFVRVFARGAVVASALAETPVRAVVHSHHSKKDPVVRDFEGAVMSYYLRDGKEIQHNGRAHSNTFDILLLGRDLDAFVRSVGNDFLCATVMAVSVKHHIDIHDPFKKGRDANYSNLAAQKRLLQPFRDHFHGFAKVKINGKVDKVLAATVLREVKHEALPDPDEFIACVTQLKDEGNAFFREGVLSRAMHQWRMAVDRMMRLRSSLIWPQVRTQLGLEFVDRVAELFYNVHSNQVMAVLAEMHEYHPDEIERMEDAMDRIGQMSNMAATAVDAFDSAWEPSVRHEAKLFFRSAQGARLAMDLSFAQSCIEVALDLQPNDAEILKEYQEIRHIVHCVLRDGGV
ncbi:unnamed protein product [Discula destructiva]